MKERDEGYAPVFDVHSDTSPFGVHLYLMNNPAADSSVSSKRVRYRT
jgi:hypothetical protein